jgi:hypothetical protein
MASMVLCIAISAQFPNPNADFRIMAILCSDLDMVRRTKKQPYLSWD